MKSSLSDDWLKQKEEMTAQPDPGGDKPQRKSSHTMERTKLTDWKKLAQNKKLKQQMKQKAESVATSSNGAVRPGPKPWNKIKPDLSIDERLSSSGNIENDNVTTLSTPSESSPLPGNSQNSKISNQPPIGIIDGGRLTGFDNFENSQPRPHDNRMFKIGLGVFGAIALVLGTMLSIFYIQKKKKDEQLKRRKVRQKSPPGTYPGGGYPPPQMGYEAPYGDPMVNHMQMPYPGAYHPQFAFQPQFDAEFNPAGYSPAEQFYNQQQYEANYYNMCQEYILQQRQMQMEANMEVYQTPQAIMGEKGYNTVMQYVEQIGDNLKTPKAKHKRNDGNSTPHPIITRRAPSMKSLAQSEISCWTEYEVENEVEKSDIDQSDLEAHENVENQKDDSTSTKSDSAYGSRGSIQSPNRRLKGQMATSSHMFESDHSDRDVESDRLSENVGDMSENDETENIKNNQTTNQLGKKTVSINVEETTKINTETVSVQ